MTTQFSAKRLLILFATCALGLTLLALTSQQVFSSPAALTNAEEEFTISAPESLALHPNEAFTFTVAISVTSGFTQPIAFSAVSDPRIPITPVTATITGPLDIDMSGMVSTAVLLNQPYTITLSGTGGGLTQTADVHITVDNYKQHLPAIFNDYCAATYVEEFNDPALSGWPVLDDGNTALRYIDGNYSILQRRENSYLILAVDEWEYETTNVMKIDGFRVNGDGIWGLAYGINSDWSEFYTFEIYPAQQRYYVLRFSAGNWTLIESNQTSLINPTGANTLYINHEIKSLTPRLAINDKNNTIFSFYFPAGRIGITSAAFTNDADQRFDKYFLSQGTCPVPAGLSVANVDLQRFERPSLDELLDTQPSE